MMDENLHHLRQVLHTERQVTRHRWHIAGPNIDFGQGELYVRTRDKVTLEIQHLPQPYLHDMPGELGDKADTGGSR